MTSKSPNLGKNNIFIDGLVKSTAYTLHIRAYIYAVVGQQTTDLYANRNSGIKIEGFYSCFQVDYKVLAERLAKKLEDQGKRKIIPTPFCSSQASKTVMY